MALLSAGVLPSRQRLQTRDLERETEKMNVSAAVNTQTHTSVVTLQVTTLRARKRPPVLAPPGS